MDNLRKQGKLRAIKVGTKVRFKRSEVERYLESEKENADGAKVPSRTAMRKVVAA